MKAIVAFLLIAASGCSGRECNPGPSTEDFAGQNLLLDEYMVDKCFNLAECSDSACVQNVYTYREGDMRMTNEGWVWDYRAPNLYVIDDYELDVYHSDEEKDCWDIEAFVLDLQAQACPCPYLPLIDRNLR